MTLPVSITDCLCDVNCNIEECDWDGGDCELIPDRGCEQCSDGCYRNFLSDGKPSKLLTRL